jgi:hypothetical protein
MNAANSKPLVGGAIAAALALLGGITYVSTRPPDVSQLEAEVDGYLREPNPQVRYKEPRRTAEGVARLVNDDRFERLPQRKQDELRAYLQSLKDYAERQERLAKIGDPTEVRNEDQLRALEDALTDLRARPEFKTAWRGTDLDQRSGELLEDVRALDRAAKGLQLDYRRLSDDGREVLRNKDAANLPGRARRVLEQASKLPDPKKDRATKVPGSARVTYTTVFSFPSVTEARRSWEEVRSKLAPLAELGKS